MPIDLKELIHKSASQKERHKAIKILAKTFYIELRRSGFDESDIINIASEILDALIKKIEQHKCSHEK